MRELSQDSLAFLPSCSTTGSTKLLDMTVRTQETQGSWSSAANARTKLASQGTPTAARAGDGPARRNASESGTERLSLLASIDGASDEHKAGTAMFPEWPILVGSARDPDSKYWSEERQRKVRRLLSEPASPLASAGAMAALREEQ